MPTTTLNPILDTHVSEANPTQGNSTNDELRVRGTGNSNALIPFVKYDTSAVTDTYGTTTFRVKVSQIGNPVVVSQVADNSWEASVNWNTKPAVGAAIGTISPATADVFLDLDVSSYVTAAGTYSFAMTQADSSDIAEFYSMNAASSADWPQLVIVSSAAAASVTLGTATKDAKGANNIWATVPVSGDVADFSYVAQTSPSGSATWTTNAGTTWFGAGSTTVWGQLVGLNAGSAYDVRFLADETSGAGSAISGTLTVTTDYLAPWPRAYDGTADGRKAFLPIAGWYGPPKAVNSNDTAAKWATTDILFYLANNLDSDTATIRGLHHDTPTEDSPGSPPLWEYTLNDELYFVDNGDGTYSSDAAARRTQDWAKDNLIDRKSAGVNFVRDHPAWGSSVQIWQFLHGNENAFLHQKNVAKSPSTRLFSLSNQNGEKKWVLNPNPNTVLSNGETMAEFKTQLLLRIAYERHSDNEEINNRFNGWFFDNYDRGDGIRAGQDSQEYAGDDATYRDHKAATITALINGTGHRIGANATGMLKASNNLADWGDGTEVLTLVMHEAWGLDWSTDTPVYLSATDWKTQLDGIITLLNDNTSLYAHVVTQIVDKGKDYTFDGSINASFVIDRRHVFFGYCSALLARASITSTPDRLIWRGKDGHFQGSNRLRILEEDAFASTADDGWTGTGWDLDLGTADGPYDEEVDGSAVGVGIYYADYTEGSNTYRVRVNPQSTDKTSTFGTLAAQSAQIVTTSSADETAPTVPANLSATADGISAIDLAWDASTDAVGVDHYDVERDSVVVATVTTNSYSDTGLDANTEYAYRVRAVDAAGNASDFSTSDSATTDAGAVTITSPASGATVSEVITITATVTGAIEQVRFEYGEDVEIATVTSSPFTTTLNTRQLENGDLTITAVGLASDGTTELDTTTAGYIIENADVVGHNITAIIATVPVGTTTLELEPS